MTSLLAAYTPFYSIYPGSKSPVEHFTRAASKEFGKRRISVNAICPGPIDTPFFYGQENDESTTYNKAGATLGKYSKTGRPDRYRRYRAARQVSCDGRMVDHGTDDLREWRLIPRGKRGAPVGRPRD